MRNRARILGFVLAIVVALTSLGGAPGTAQAVTAPPVALTLEGRPLATSGNLLDGTTVVSLKDLAAELGLTYYGPSDGQAVVSYGDKRVAFRIDSSWAVVNGHEVLIPHVAAREGDQVIVPLRFLLENLGFAVKWSDSPVMRVDIRPVTENPIVIGTVRERQETAALRIDLQYPRIVGLVADVQGQLNSFFANRTAPVVEQAYQSEQDSQASADYHWTTEVFCNYTVAYNQQNLLSLVFDDYLYTGGAHGMTHRAGYTVDIRTGTSYALKDLFIPGADYVGLISGEIKKQIDAQGLATLGEFSRIRDDQDYYINDGDLVVYFQQYELMPYAFGFPEFRIPLDSLKLVLIPELAARDWAPAE